MRDDNRLPVAQSSACSLSAALCDYRETMRLKVIHVTIFMNRTLTAEPHASFCIRIRLFFTNHNWLKYVRTKCANLAVRENEMDCGDYTKSGKEKGRIKG